MSDFMTEVVGPFCALFTSIVLIEAPVAFALAPAGRRAEIAWYSVAMNAVTIAMVGVPFEWGVEPWIFVVLAVLVAEALGYRWLARLRSLHAIAIAICANGASLAALIVVAAWVWTWAGSP